MNQKLLFLFSLLLTLGTSSMAQVVFYEDFQTSGGTFPNGWFLRNVDNSTPNASVNFINNAWIVREDYALNVADSAAFSTSWYTPAGTADDWMWTPLMGPLPANCVLSWNAVTYDPSYPDGYEVRVMTSAQGPPTGGSGVLGNQVTNSTQIFSVAAENSSWTSHTVNLNSYAGQSVYIGFRNHSTDKYLLLIDDVKVEVQVSDDVALDSIDQREYTLTPLAQVPAGGYPLSARIINNGSNNATGVSLSVSVYNSSNAIVHNATSSTTSIASGASATLSATPFTPAAADDYMVIYSANLTGTDQLPANNVDTQYITITNSVYARDNGNVVGSLGIGAGNGGYLGQDFLLETAADLNAIGIYYTIGYPGQRMAVAVWSMQADTPLAIIASTDTLVYPDDSARFYTLPMFGGTVHLNAGRYAFTAIEFDSTLAVGQASGLFTLGRTWVKWPTSPLGGWGNNEDFGASFAKSYVIRPVFCGTITPTVTPTAATCAATNGQASVSVNGGETPYSYHWSTGASTSSITGVSAGNYGLTVTDAVGCSVTSTTTISANNTAITSNITSTASICTAANGSATVAPTNGTASYTYLWSSGSSSATATNLAGGSYQVTVTDANGCSGTASVSVTTNQVTLTGTTSITPSSCSANTGSIAVTVTNGSSPYTYAWSNQGNVDSITNVGPGAYQVTITDANGCSGTASGTVTTPNGPSASATATNVACNGASTGAVSLTVTGGTAPLAYQWSNSVTAQNLNNVQAGNYTVTITDANSCSFTVSISVTEPTALAVTGTATDATNGNNGAVDLNVSGGTTGYSYNWSNGSSTEDISGLASGTYTVTVTDANSCSSTASFTIVSTGIAGADQISAFQLFPNPASTSVQIQLSMLQPNSLKVTITDVTGKVIWSEQTTAVSEYHRTLSLSSFASGIYLVQLSSQQVHITERLVIEK